MGVILVSPLVSIIIVNWNGVGFLRDCLSSIFTQSFTDFEVIVVDNGSTDSSLDLLRTEFDKARVIELSSNTGFAIGNNRGIERARGEFVLTLNNDTVLDKDFISTLVASVRGADKDVGMWAPKILSLRDKGEIDSVGGLLIYPDCLAKGRGRLERDTGQYDSLGEVFIPSACAALYRKEMLDSIGLFDEDFFAYCEDTDLGLRGRLNGWKAISVPSARVYHYYSGTGGSYSPLKAYLVERNHIWVALKCLPLSLLLILPFHIIRRFLVQLYGIISGRGAGGRFVEDFSALKLVLIVFKAYGAVIVGLPGVLKKRRQVRAGSRLSTREIRDLLRRFALSATDLVLKD